MKITIARWATVLAVMVAACGLFATTASAYAPASFRPQWGTILGNPDCYRVAPADKFMTPVCQVTSWSYGSGGWTESDRVVGRQVWVYPYSRGWVWTWTQQEGWTAMSSQYIQLSSY